MGMNCDICKNGIEKETEIYYSCMLNREHLDGMTENERAIGNFYVVDSSVEHFRASADCLSKYDVRGEIHQVLGDHIRTANVKTSPSPDKVTVLHSHYSCDLCDKDIADRSHINCVVHNLETWNGGVIVHPHESENGVILCDPCAKHVNLQKKLSEAVSLFAASAGRQRK